jgi:dipeptidyl-peptidase-4
MARDLPVERLFDAPDLQGPALRQMRFSPDGKLVSYLRGRDDAPAVFDLWAYDVAQRTHRLLVDSRVLAPAEEKLSAEEEARRERQRIAALRGIVDYQWSPDSRAILVPLAGDLYYYDLAKPAAEAVRRLTQTEAFETDPQFSPRGRYVSFIRDRDIYAVEVATGAERRLTTGGGGLVSHGVAEFIAQEEMNRDTGYWWSPDEKHLAYARVDESPVAEVERFEIDPTGVRVLKQRYPATGHANARVTLAILALDTGDVACATSATRITTSHARNGTRRAIAPQRQARDQKRLDVLVSRDRRRARQLFSERSDTWVELQTTSTSSRAQILGLAAKRPQPPVPL